MRFLLSHPLTKDAKTAALGRYIRWQLASRLLPAPIALPFINDTRLLIESGMSGATGNWYAGLHEVNEMGFVLHALRRDELFVDVGANIGSYTILAAGAVGSEVIAVEPVAHTFSKLRDNILINGIESRVRMVNCGLSDFDGTIQFTASLDTMNRVALADERIETVDVTVTTLDGLIGESLPAVIKIDVEGHEPAVLRGGSSVFGQPTLRAVLMETNGSGEKYGTSDQDLIDKMSSYGLTACGYDAINRKIVQSDNIQQNTIFVRNVEQVQHDCQNAPKYQVMRTEI